MYMKSAVLFLIQLICGPQEACGGWWNGNRWVADDEDAEEWDEQRWGSSSSGSRSWHGSGWHDWQQGCGDWQGDWQDWASGDSDDQARRQAEEIQPLLAGAGTVNPSADAAAAGAADIIDEPTDHAGAGAINPAGAGNLWERRLRWRLRYNGSVMHKELQLILHQQPRATAAASSIVVVMAGADAANVGIAPALPPSPSTNSASSSHGSYPPDTDLTPTDSDPFDTATS